MTSVDPPGQVGTITLIGFVGNFSAEERLGNNKHPKPIIKNKYADNFLVNIITSILVYYYINFKLWRGLFSS